MFYIFYRSHLSECSCSPDAAALFVCQKCLLCVHTAVAEYVFHMSSITTAYSALII